MTALARLMAENHTAWSKDVHSDRWLFDTNESDSRYIPALEAEVDKLRKLVGLPILTNPDADRGVLAVTAWATNAELIADVARLGYLLDTDHVLDPTYERGTWWKVWRPQRLTTHHRAVDGSDFRALPYPDGSFDAIAYDPPYVCPGGRKTSTVPEMHARYGMAEGGHEDPMFSTPAELQAIIDAGLTEMVRLVRPARSKTAGGIILVKCQNYIWSGHLWEGAERTRQHAIDLGCTVVDRLEMLGTPGPQPTVNPVGSPRRQVHARRNLSTLFVLRAPKQLSPSLFDPVIPEAP